MKVLVLMSVYNGQKYINEQIESIIKQRNIEVYLLIRDDGSIDETFATIRKYKNKNISLYRGKNLGAANSFMELIRKAYNEYSEIDYVAFADQDDIWLENKLERAVNFMQENNADLYCGSLDAFRNGNLDEHIIMHCYEFTSNERILRNSVAGCTMVLRRTALARVCEYKPAFLEMHDSWIVRICTYTGLRVVYDMEPYIRYRLHGENTCGAAVTIPSKVVSHFNNFFRRDSNLVSFTAHELLKGYRERINSIDREYLEVLDKMTNTVNRKIKLLKINSRVRFSTRLRKVNFMIEVLLGKI